MWTIRPRRKHEPVPWLFLCGFGTVLDRHRLAWPSIFKMTDSPNFRHHYFQFGDTVSCTVD